MVFNAMIGAFLDWVLQGAVDAWKQTCAMALQAGVITSGQWTVAGSIIGKVAGVVLFVVILSAGYAIARAATAGRMGDIWRISGQALLSWPLTMAALWVMVQAINISTALTGLILGVDLTSPKLQAPSLPGLSAAAIKGQFAGPLLVVMLVIMLFAAASLLLCMGARQFLLVVAVCLLPAGIMDTGFARRAMGAARKYIVWVIGIILYQPLVGLFITITGELMKAAGSDNPMAFLEAIVGMVLSSVFPWVLVAKFAGHLPAGQGLNTAATAGRQTVGKAKEEAGKAAAAAVQIAGAVATGGASAAGMGAGAAGAGAKASGSAASEASKAANPSKDAGGPTGGTPGTPADGTRNGGSSHAPTPAGSPSSPGAAPASGSGSGHAPGSGMGGIAKAGLAAAAASMRTSPAVAGMAAAMNTAAAQLAPAPGAAPSPAAPGARDEAGPAGAPAMTAPGAPGSPSSPSPAPSPQPAPGPGREGPESGGTPHVTVHVESGGARGANAHVDQ
jgi:hypothetical protein